MHKILIDDLWQELKLPENYNMASHQTVKHDQLPIVHYRFTVEGNGNNGGEHISFTIGENQQLQGVMVMNADLQHGILPSESEAREIACQFIADHAPDLQDDLELKWVAEHEEVIHLDDKDIIISGMKVKCRIKSSGKYVWVIVGKNHLPITFERDIIWNFDMSQRQTEKWLHDSWLSEENEQ